MSCIDRPLPMRQALCALLLTLVTVLPFARAGDDLEAVLEQHRQHGFGSPQAAIEQLTAHRDEAGPNAPLARRLQYHAALASLYIAAERHTEVQQELQELARMANQQCLPCLQYKLLREEQWLVRKQDFSGARALAKQFIALPAPTDPNILQLMHYVRGMEFDAMGDHAQAIAHGVQAVDQAIKAKNPAEQVRSLNLLLLSHIGRRDLVRAQSYANEGYALADSIGFPYMMAYIRTNAAWLYSLKQDKAMQLKALNDVQRITHSNPGLGDVELVNLVNLAEFHSTNKDHRQAAKVSSEAVELARRQNKPLAKAVAMTSLGEAQVQLGLLEQGIASLREAAASLKTLEANSYRIETLNGLTKALERHGQQQEALATLHELIALKDSEHTHQRDKIASEAHEKFSAERKDREIERLSLESGMRLAESEAIRFRQWLWAAVALALILSMSLLVLIVKRMTTSNRRLTVHNAELSDQSVHDPLTGAYNRRHCTMLMGQQEALLATRSRERQYTPCVGLMLLDVDYFKLINDTQGHAAGDAVLVGMAQRLQALLRQQDAVVRWGGEEFVLVLPGTSPDGMVILAERVLRTIAEQPFMVNQVPIRVTVSIGAVGYPLAPELNWEGTLRVADAAMYKAKQQGRNRALCLMHIAPEAIKMLTERGLGKVDPTQIELATIEGPPLARGDQGD